MTKNQIVGISSVSNQGANLIVDVGDEQLVDISVSSNWCNANEPRPGGYLVETPQGNYEYEAE